MEFKTKPYAHQLAEYLRSRDDVSRAIFWEQGTGKSKHGIDVACHLYERGLIDGVLTIAPSGVHRNWVTDELPMHLPDCLLGKVRAFAYSAARADTKRHQREVDAVLNHDGFAWLTMSYDAFRTKQGHKTLVQWFTKRRCLYNLDEAHNIKEPTAKRTRSILKSAKYAPFRRIMTGTPISQGPFDVYTEILFLDEGFWQRNGIGSYTEFRHRYGVFKQMWNPTAFNPETKARSGRAVDVLVGYKCLDELKQMIAPIVSRVTKDDVLDLPPKLYQKRYFPMSDEQARLYKEMRDDFVAWLATDGKEVAESENTCDVCSGTREMVIDGFCYPCTSCPPVEFDSSEAVVASQAMVRIMRLQQIACGYLPTQNDEQPIYRIPGPNPRLEALVEEVEQSPHKVIVWSRFKLGVTDIIEALTARGIRCVRYDGEVDEDGRAEAKALFTGRRPTYSGGQVTGSEAIPEEEQAKVFVGNPAVGATGLTLVEARMTIYYANNFKLTDRLQSEDRCHRIGQLNQVLYVDLIAEDSIDEKIVVKLRTKQDVASQITGDKLKEWI